MIQDLFGYDIPKNTEPKEDIQITTTILYMDEKELKQFKKLCKIGIKQLYGDTFQEKGNYTDLILHLLNKEYGS
jgi:hypothetical protein